MRIGVDAREINSRPAGKGRYVEQLVESLIALFPEDEYFLFTYQIPKESLNRNVVWIRLPKFPPGMWIFCLAWQTKKYRLDAFLSPTSYIASLAALVPTVTTIHDLAVFVEPKTRPALKTAVIERLTLPLALKKSKHIIAVSQNTKRDLRRIFKVPESKVSVIYQAAFPVPAKEVSSKITARSHRLPKRFILFVGTLEPRKNIESLIKAYELLPGALRQAVPLVLVGKMGWRSGALRQAIKNSPCRRSIRVIGYLPIADLVNFYRLATVFAYPSWYEGFGLPVLEALSQGAPVVASNTSSLPEIALGSAALLTPPQDIKKLKGALLKVISDEKFRAALIQKAVWRARFFSWDKTAKETRAVLAAVQKEKNYPTIKL